MRLASVVLLSSVAAFATMSQGSAADLPMTKAAPIDYVRVCSIHGAGFFYIPGGDVCLKVGGYVRAEYLYAQPKWSVPGNGRSADATGFLARGRLEVDARSSSEWGTIRAFFRFELTRTTGAYRALGVPAGSVTDSSLDKAFIQFAGFTAGVAQSFFDFYANDLNYGGSLGSDNGQTQLLAYSATFGSGFSATIALEDRNQRNVGTSYYSAAGQRLPDVVGNLLVDQDWGSAQLSGALHQLNSSTIYGSNVYGSRVDSTYGFAVQGGVKVKLPMLAAGDYLWLQAAYTDGALSYIGINGDQAIGPLVGIAADGVIVNGDIKKTKGWNALAAMLHYWTPNIRQSVFGGYTKVNYSGAVTSTYNGLSDFNTWTVGSNLIWSPVSAMDIGVEVLYTKLDPNGRTLVYDNGVTAIYKSSEDQWQARLRFQRDF
ncbi:MULTISPECIES: porin [unclassified Chelatococcus]|uniref:porin n=1 Tax=unclassified Chelatococcus TaxID=2638111 RepID=UPI001BCDAC35|nr:MULTISPECIES: porin [unclassified Chelatococcus]CAH1671801.1 Porin [Hyphomicrobiales bacterium]MBS7739036.1 porin [Chelatococcus sp. HY11]MBX3543471.1 porin [Chelatococcus sp.]MCO5076434.1 porin [Chelatococcus sp.]CAH1675993.1 Porin [Hyphomicrobiales bacterium]